MSRQFRQGFFVAALLSMLAGFGFAQTAVNSSSATLTTLVSFGNGNGQRPNSPLAQGLDGNLYGTTLYGGMWRNGTVFNMTSAGVVTNLYAFCPENNCNGGRLTDAGLVLGSDGNYYGTNVGAGTGGTGTAFQVTPQGAFKVIYNFCSLSGCPDGSYPVTLVLGRDGNLYGVASGGGTNNLGTVFVMTYQGVLTTLHSFTTSEGASPRVLLQATDGNFYGVTLSGGSGAFCSPAGACGTVFKVTPGGVLTTLYNFCQVTGCADGDNPNCLIQAADGNLYGTTTIGGNAYGHGIAFKITTKGVFTTLYSFCSLSGCADGFEPFGLLQATDGYLYGSTYEGGASSNDGTLFKMTTAGAVTTLYDFCPAGGSACPDGAGPERLMQATDGSFYGVTFYGGSTGYGTAFNLSVGLKPFVTTVESGGKAGSSVMILGNNLTGATKVTFNKVSAAFTVVSSTEITTTVPAGATTGAVVVTTPSATLKSNKNFQVTK